MSGYRRVTIAEVKSHAIDRLEEILARLAPGGQFAGHQYMPRNPTRQDHRAGSFIVWTKGGMRGAWKEFAAGDAEKGDVIDLVSYCLAGGIDYRSKSARSRALAWIADFCGLANLPSTARAAALEAAQQRRRQGEREAIDAASKARRAFSMWLNAAPIGDTIGELYLREKRGIELRDVARLEADIRFAKSLEWWMGRKRTPDGRVIAHGPFFPAIVCAMRSAIGEVRAVHVTYLAPDGSDKAPVAKPKLIWPAYKGCVIRLTKGESGMTPEEASAAGFSGPCGLSEGLEDGLSMALGAPELRVWAAAALSNLANVPALPCVDAFVVHRQNDWHSSAAIAAFEHAKEALEATGRPVVELTVPRSVGKDLNDVMRS